MRGRQAVERLTVPEVAGPAPETGAAPFPRIIRAVSTESLAVLQTLIRLPRRGGFGFR